MVNIWWVLLIQLIFLFLIIIGIIIRNLYIKNNKLKQIVEKQDSYITEIYQSIKYSEEKIKEIDSKQLFQSDDEVGFFFTNLKKLQNALSEYIIHIKPNN